MNDMLTKIEIRDLIVKYKKQDFLGWPMMLGNSWFSSGFVYAPYIPLIITPTYIFESSSYSTATPVSGAIEPSTIFSSLFQQSDTLESSRKGVMTRYAKQILSSSYYSTVSFDTAGALIHSGSSSKKMKSDIRKQYDKDKHIGES